MSAVPVPCRSLQSATTPDPDHTLWLSVSDGGSIPAAHAPACRESEGAGHLLAYDTIRYAGYLHSTFLVRTFGGTFLVRNVISSEDDTTVLYDATEVRCPRTARALFESLRNKLPDGALTFPESIDE